MKLRKWVKVTLTMILIAIGIIIYLDLRTKGMEAINNDFKLMMCIFGWTYLFAIQPLIGWFIWEEL